MTVPSNILQQVQTYQMANLALLLNYGCFIHTANKKFKNFDSLIANLGDTVTFDLPPRFTMIPSLVFANNFEPSTQRVQSLTVDQQGAVPYAFTAQQFIFNVEQYVKVFGRSATAELASNIESYVAGLCETQPYRFFGNGISPIASVNQLASMLALYKTYGYPHETIRGYLLDVAVPQIAASMQNQFVPNRNEEVAQSWMVGDWSGVEWYQSNLLPLHVSGNVANNQNTLTVVSTNDPTGANITQITFSGASDSDPDAILQYDRFVFNDGTGFPNLRFRNFVGHQVGAAPVQFQASASAASDSSGHVVVNITPGLCVTSGNANQNLNTNIVAGMECTVIPSHRPGTLVGGDSMYLAMPRLPEQIPYPTSNHVDEETGASTRLTYGSVFGQNQYGFAHDAIWGATMPPEYGMAVIFPA